MPKGRVWVDVLTPKQVLFFTPLVEDLRKLGFQVMSTSRKYREVAPIADRVGLELRYVGERGGSDRASQLVASTRRQSEIIPLVSDFGPDLAVSVASGVCARVAFGLGVRHLAVNDSPHSEVAGRLSLPLSYHLMCPWVIPFSAWSKFGLRRNMITTYHALDAAVWLKRKMAKGPIPDLNPRKKTIIVRVPESDSPYLAGEDRGWMGIVLRSLAEAFSDCNLVVLCRYEYQVDDVRREFGSRFIVPDEAVDGRGLLAASDLFVGMGGTMNAEAGLMGVPAISAFQGPFLHVDAYLESVGLLAKVGKPVSLVKTARRFLEPFFKREFAKRAARILGSMEDPIPRIAGFIAKSIEQA